MADRLDVIPADLPTRRAFCTAACQAALSTVALGALLEGCGGGSSSNPSGPSGASNLPVLAGTLNGNVLTVAVDSVAVGSAALVSAGGTSVLIAHTAADTFSAFSSMCTHQACTITGWSAPNFLCPCHGSLFSASGQVVRGPASRALTQYGTSLVGNTLTVTG